jgi:threonine synthase
MREQLNVFQGGFATEEQTFETIRKVYEKADYIMDTHTAVASSVYYDLAAESGRKTVIASTASPYKFTRSVMDAIDKEKYDSMSDFELVDELNRISGVNVPGAIEEIRTAPIVHDIVCDTNDMQATVEKILGL